VRLGLIDHAAWAPGGAEGLADDLRAGRSRLVDGEGRSPEPVRPEAIPAGQWRRMGWLARAVGACAAAVRARHPEVDWTAAPVIWGTVLGEVAASSALLDRLHAEGPSRVSPLLFQGSAYNAAIGRLSLALDLRGPTETVACGPVSAVAALRRAGAWLARSPHVLVLAGDELAEATGKALRRVGAPPGEGALAMLVGPGDDLQLSDGPDGPAPRLGRTHTLPWEEAPLPPVDVAVDDLLGTSAVLPLIALLALGRGTAVACDDGWAQAVRLDARASGSIASAHGSWKLNHCSG